MITIRTFLGFCRSRAAAAIILAGSGALLVPVSDVAAQSLTPTMSILHDFQSDGIPPGEEMRGTLVEATDLNFYGTTWGGGTHQAGTVFRMARAEHHDPAFLRRGLRWRAASRRFDSGTQRFALRDFVCRRNRWPRHCVHDDTRWDTHRASQLPRNRGRTTRSGTS